MSVAFALAFTLMTSGAGEVRAEDWLTVLKAERANGLLPKAVVIQRRTFGPSTAFSLYPAPRSEGGSGWIARREVEGAETAGVAWTSSWTCEALNGAVTTIERVALPRVELRTSRLTGEGGGPPPRMGSTEQSHLLWVTAWDDENAPVQLTLSSLGSGPAQHLYDDLSSALASCWTDTPPNISDGAGDGSVRH